MKKKYIEGLLIDIVRLNEHCKRRCLEKMNSSKRGFGKNNEVESISFYENEAIITVVDSGYDLRDVASESINIDEICMTEAEWKEHLLKIKQKIDQEKELKKQNEMREKKLTRKLKYLELKKEFDNIQFINLNGIQMKEGDTMTLIGRNFELIIDREFDEKFAIWLSHEKEPHILIKATPNFKGNQGLQVDLEIDYYQVDSDFWNKTDIKDYDHYKGMVIDLAGRLIEKHNAKFNKTKSKKDLKKGDRVKISGWGRTSRWGNLEGTVTKKKGKSIFVHWDGTSFEDEMDIREIKLI